MLEAKAIYKTYKDGKTSLHVLKGIDIEIKKGEKLSIVGPSGAGKSTLLHILGGLDKPTSGKVFLDDIDFYKIKESEKSGIINSRIGFVFQFYHLLSEFTALENVMLPALISKNDAGVNFNKLQDSAKGILKELKLGDRLKHRPGELSGGEQQRVAIGRAIINNPSILLCDEPTGNLDSKIGEEILDILFSLNKNHNTTVIIVTHDKAIAKRSDRILEIRDGKIV